MSNGGVNFGWRSVWPDWTAFVTGDIAAGRAMLNLVAFFFLAVTLITVIYMLWHAIRGTAKLRFLRRCLFELTPETAAVKRKETAESIMENPAVEGFWRRFNRSLVPGSAISGEGAVLYSAADPRDVFSADRFARPLVHNRFLDVMPVLLAGVGVLATLVAVQSGWQGLTDIVPRGVKTGSMVRVVVYSLSAVVWGGICALAVSLTRSIAVSTVGNAAAALHHRLEELYPRVPAVQSLFQIRSDTRQSRESLQVLSEQVGDRMQDAVLQISEHVESAILNVMNPSIRELVKASDELTRRQARESENILKRLVEEFTERIHREAEKQQDLMGTASRSMREHLNNAMTSVRESAESIRESMTKNRDDARRLLTNLDERAESFLQRSESRFTAMEDRRMESFKKRMELFETTQTALVEKVRSVADGQAESARTILEMGNLLLEGMTEAKNGLAEAAEKLGEPAIRMAETTVHLKELGTAFETSTNTLSASLQAAGEAGERFIEENTRIHAEVNSVLETIQHLRADFLAAGGQLRESAQIAGRDFKSLSENHQRLHLAMKAHVKEVETEVSRLLNRYSEQVNEQTTNRLNEWNRQTRAFSEAMTASVNAIAALVEDIESLKKTEET